MSVKVEADALADALALATKAVSRQYFGNPILTCVRLTAADGEVTTTGTDLTTTGSKVVPAGRGTLDIVVPGMLARSIVEKMSGPVTISAKGGEVTLTDASGHATLRTASVTEWPRMRMAEGDPVKLTGDEARAIASVIHAAAGPNDREDLAAVHFHDGNALATDSYRLAIVALAAGLPDAIIPAKALAPLLALAADDGAEVCADERTFTFTVGAVSWTISTVAGSSPAYQQLLRDDSPCHLTVRCDDLLTALDRVLPLADTSNQPAWISPVDDGIRVSTSRREDGQAEVHVPAQWDGDAFEIGFNIGFLSQLVKAVDGETVTFGLIDALKPAVVTDGARRELLMPARRGAS